MKRGRPRHKKIKLKINKLVKSGFNYSEIAKMLGLKSKQLARYHHLSTGKLDKEK